MGKKAFCIHGHFYQPPREDPLTEIIPLEKGAAPYSNWNERIVDDCYRPNAEEGNFGNMSFNIGPTLAEKITRQS
jgi:alpha-amylase/alpha-mannosidase (GH57 family)